MCLVFMKKTDNFCVRLFLCLFFIWVLMKKRKWIFMNFDNYNNRWDYEILIIISMVCSLIVNDLRIDCDKTEDA